MVRRKKCRTRKTLKNSPLAAKNGVDTAENEPRKGLKNAYSTSYLHLSSELLAVLRRLRRARRFRLLRPRPRPPRDRPALPGACTARRKHSHAAVSCSPLVESGANCETATKARGKAAGKRCSSRCCCTRQRPPAGRSGTSTLPELKQLNLGILEISGKGKTSACSFWLVSATIFVIKYSFQIASIKNMILILI